MKNILLITSTISPKSTVYSLAVTDELLRLSQYTEAFRFYISTLKSGLFEKIIYVDNSGYDLQSLMDIAKEEQVSADVEFISYTSTVEAENQNRFYLEAKLIEYSLENSHFLTHHTDCMIWKVTGRYIVKNISRIISKLANEKPFLFCANFRNFPSQWVDFYLAGFTVKSFNYLFKENFNLYEGNISGEAVLRKFIDTQKIPFEVHKRFPDTPLIHGTRGLDGSQYGTGKDLVKYYVRKISLVLFPFLWF